ncbi:protein-disulfide reductase DsbD [Glaciecola sp. 2405UD65-10]|uniref:protein-disulfide reductase DsbD n=1 Tax=Glaciecola sp. 2405UD65-10 TaxID=3397244 RepID=UPI003B5C2D25
MLKNSSNALFSSQAKPTHGNINKGFHAYFTLLFLISSMLVFANQALAQSTPEPLFNDAPTFLKVDEAFGFDYEQTENKLIIRWTIAEGYYLYKKQFKTVTKGVTLSEPSFPESQQIEDEFFGLSDVFFDDMEMVYTIDAAQKDASVKIRFQGCASAGLCYPPTTQVVFLDAVNESGSSSNTRALKDNSASQNSSAPVSAQFNLADELLSDQSIFISLGVLALLGLGLAFTPCVYPMYPILSSIVIGKGKQQVSSSQAFALSFVYVQGMAITYSIIGLIVASAGVQFQAALQNPILLGVFIVLFVLLALAMFGLYEIQLPQKWQEKLNNLSNGQKQGNYVGVFVMGVVSGLVASPCTTAPLTAVLMVVAQSDSLLFGFAALYALSMGMGIPLILFGVTGGKLLPKAGNWMNVIKATFGFMMLTVAIIFVERIFVSDWTNLLWAVLGLSLFSYWFTVNLNTQMSFAKGVRTLISAAGLIIAVIFTLVSLQKLNLAPALIGSSTPHEAKSEHPEFEVVRNLADFEAKLASANSNGQTVMLDLYADWCVACKEFEKYTFPDPAVVKALSSAVWMQIDLTDNTPDNIAFQEAFNITGLPTILFFNEQGEELRRSRVTGFMNAESFAEHVSLTLNKN